MEKPRISVRPSHTLGSSPGFSREAKKSKRTPALRHPPTPHPRCVLRNSLHPSSTHPQPPPSSASVLWQPTHTPPTGRLLSGGLRGRKKRLTDPHSWLAGFCAASFFQPRAALRPEVTSALRCSRRVGRAGCVSELKMLTFDNGKLKGCSDFCRLMG